MVGQESQVLVLVFVETSLKEEVSAEFPGAVPWPGRASGGPAEGRGAPGLAGCGG